MNETAECRRKKPLHETIEQQQQRYATEVFSYFFNQDIFEKTTFIGSKKMYDEFMRKEYREVGKGNYGTVYVDEEKEHAYKKITFSSSDYTDELNASLIELYSLNEDGELGSCKYYIDKKMCLIRMKYINGKTLESCKNDDYIDADFITKLYKYGIDKIYGWAEKGFLNLDIKLSNMMLSQNGDFRFIDYALYSYSIGVYLGGFTKIYASPEVFDDDFILIDKKMAIKENITISLFSFALSIIYLIDKTKQTEDLLSYEGKIAVAKRAIQTDLFLSLDLAIQQSLIKWLRLNKDNN